MAYDYEKVKQAYEGLDAQQKQKFADMMKWSGNYADFMSRYNAEKTPTTTASTTTANSSTPTQTSTSRNIAKPEYQWTWSIWTKTSPYENQGEWNYYYSNQTNRYEKYPTATQTSTQTTKVETPAENDTVKQLRDAWNNKSYEEQQKLLKSNPAMQNTLTKYWITNKQPETTPAQTPTQTPTAQKDKEWDYQDNSQARTDEIIRNLDWFRVTDPYLFDNYHTFYNAFIAGKGRSQDQIKTLNDYYDKMKQYNKYDNLSSDEVGWMIARWEIPDDYLNYLKNSDPQRWAEIQWVRKDVEDQIMNESYLNTIASDAWFDMWENDFMKWQKWTFWLEDKNSDWLWDIIYHAPTQEELDLNNEDNEYEAEKLRIKNAYKDLQSDLTDQYPDADLSTIMVLAWDRGNKMLKALDSISVAQTKTQWRLKYLQNERAEMDKAWQTQINELQQNLWMYYQYSPEWIAELAQAQYWATNITLDQADSWNETQKQMALQSVLDDYYAKYGSIIQRSEQQVINDVIAYAKKNWIWLAQALQENFVKPLQQKPQFATLSTGWSLTADKWAKLNDNTLYNVTTWETISADWWNVSVTTSRWATITPISAASNSETTNNLMSKYPIWSSYKNWECWELMNLDASSSGSNIHFWSDLSEKTKWINRETYEWPQIWAYVVFDWSNKPWASEKMQKYWHVWKVVWMWDWYIDVRNQNGTKSWQITVDRYSLKDYEKYIAWYVDPTKTEDYWYWGSPLDDQFAAIQNASSKLNKDQKEALDFADSAYMMMYKLASNWDLDYFLKSPDGQKVLSNYAAAQFSNNANYTEDQILSTLKNNVTDQRILWIVNDLMTIIEKKLRWTSWAAISGSEWNSNSKMLIPQAWESYGTQFRKFQTFEWEYLKKPFETMWRYAWVNTNYIPLFTWNSPYYTKYAVSAEQEADEAI